MQAAGCRLPSPRTMRLIRNVARQGAEQPDLTGINYSDTTPSVVFTYHRLGRQKTVTDAVGTREFVYNGEDLQLDREKINELGGGLYSKTIVRTYQGSGTGQVPGRPSGFQIGTGTPEYETVYHYDAYGRIERITGPGLLAHGVVSARLANSELVEYTWYKGGVTGGRAPVPYPVPWAGCPGVRASSNYLRSRSVLPRMRE